MIAFICCSATSGFGLKFNTLGELKSILGIAAMG